jgi:hypothetical protein
MRMTVLPWVVWGVIGIVSIIALVKCSPAHAEARFAADADNGKVVLFDDKCQLSEVTNLPFKAQWTENGKTTEGCWSPPHPQVGVILAYFADKTVVGLPAQIFKRLQQS